ncbi:MAG: F0F1 ATP synthase subunit B [Anaerolineae bacterium]|nr:F0F1 ATP synthase subunit B [Anaerolineae bacterium]
MERLGINSGFLLAQIVNFLLIALILWLLVWKPMVRALEARKERIAKGLEDARQAEQKLASAERDAQKLIEQRRVEANKLLEEGRANVDTQIKALLDEARHEAEAIRARARAEATEERDAMLQSVRAQVGEIALAAAERVIGQSLDTSKAQGIIADFIAQAPEGAANLGREVEVTSALPLNDAEKAQIKKHTGATEIVFKVDPAILGGLILRSGERVVDGSVRSRLNSLAATMA